MWYNPFKNFFRMRQGENIKSRIGAVGFIYHDHFLIPGLGQACSKKYLRAIIIFLIAVVIYFVKFKWFGNSLIGNIVSIIYALITAYDAYSIAAREDTV